MKTFNNIAFATLLGASALAMTTAAASAHIVCNAEGDCWHTHAEYNYAPSLGLIIHPDNWRWKEGERHAWREHDGRGYWQGGAWKEF